jgi:hypothetical protein
VTWGASNGPPIPPKTPALVAPRGTRGRSSLLRTGSEFAGAARGLAGGIEGKWSADELDPAGLNAFRNRYPQGHNIVVATDIDTPVTRRFGSLVVRLVGLKDLPAEVASSTAPKPRTAEAK